MSAQHSTFKRFVEVGRVVLVKDDSSTGRLAAIVEIIDHNRAIIDGPLTSVPRQAFAFRHLVLTPYKLKKLARGARTGIVAKHFAAENIVSKWEKSSWAKRITAQQTRRSLTDFDRFNVMLLKKQRRDVVRKALVKARTSSA